MTPLMVGTKTDLEMMKNNYLVQGFQVTQHTPTSVIMTKPKKFNWAIAALLVFTGFGIILYAGYYFLVQKNESVCINCNQQSAAA